jgi:hypothetical protein
LRGLTAIMVFYHANRHSPNPDASKSDRIAAKDGL